MGNEITLMQALYITVSSMTIVFSILLLISLILGSFKTIFKEKNKPEVQKVENKEIAMTNEEDEEEKIVVALAASIMAREGNLNPNLRIKSITRIK